MPSLTSIVAAAKQAAKAPVQSAKFDAAAAVQGSALKTKGLVQSAVGGAASAGISGVLGAATQLIEGDTSGAAKTIGSLPGNVLSKLWPFGGNKPNNLGFVQGNSSTVGNALAGINARRDAILNFNWYAVLPKVQGMSLDWYYVEAATLSYRTVDTQQVYRRSHMETFPKGYSVAPLRLGFMLDSSSLAMNYLAGWQDAIMGNYDGHVRSQGNWGRPADYKRDITVNVLSVNKQIVMSVKYYGCWPTNLDAMPLVSDASGRLIAEVEFAVDDASYEFVSAKAGGSGASSAKTVNAVKGSVSSVLGAVGNRVANTLGLRTSSSVLSTASSSLG